MIDCALKLIMEPQRMDFLKKTLSFVILTTLLTGCQLTEEEKEKIEQAGENLEKIAVAPAISFPAENDTIFKATAIRLDVDNSVSYKSMALVVDGIEVDVDYEAPYEFHWDPYFWSENQKSTFIIRAITAGNNLVRSDILTLPIGSDVHNLVRITNPLDSSVIRNVNTTDISWNARAGAVSYDYKVNGVTYSTDQTTASIALPVIGSYALSVRGVNSLGYKGKWSDESRLTLAIPAAPSIYSSDPVASENDWQVQFNWSAALASSELQIATDINFTSLLESEDLDTASYTASLVTGIYYARVRTKNEFGYISPWSDVSTIELGLFSSRINMNTYGGWSNEDAPVDFVIEDESLVIAARKSNDSDGSGDDFYVSKVTLQGLESWGKSYHNQIRSPKTIAKTSSGYVLPGNGTQWRDGKALSIDSYGNQQWLQFYTSEVGLDIDGNDTYTSERVNNIIEVAANKFVALQRTSNCTYTGPIDKWGYRPSTCPSEAVENKIQFIDRSGDAPIITEHQIAQPALGKYDQFTQLLLTDTGLYAAGRYTASDDSSQDSSADDFTPSASASGSVLLELNKVDGSILANKTRTAGGIKDSYLSSITETESGDIVVGYNNYYAAVASIFKADGSTESQIDGSKRYAQVIADPNGEGYVMLAQHRNGNYSYLTRFNEENNKVGESKVLAQCFSQLRVTSINSHPKHGLVILGTEQLGSSSNTQTVFFNVTKNFNYLCPE